MYNADCQNRQKGLRIKAADSIFHSLPHSPLNSNDKIGHFHKWFSFGFTIWTHLSEPYTVLRR